MRGLRKSTRKRIRWVIAITAIQLFLLCFCQIVLKQTTEERYEKKLEEKEAVLGAAERLVYITTETVRAGETFTTENVEQRYLLSEQDAKTLEQEAMGAVACVDLPAGVILNTSVCRKTEYGMSERRCNFRGIRFSESFDTYDSVDVRIRYGNGENYCVLKNKMLLPVTEKGNCSFILSETEQLLMSAAEFDAKVYEGAELYLVGVPQVREEEQLSVFVPTVPVLLQLREFDGENAGGSEAEITLREELEGRLFEYRKQ